MNGKNRIYIIEKINVNKRFIEGYEIVGYKPTEDDAKKYCDSFGYLTEKDCWGISFYAEKKIPKYSYREVEYCK